MTEGIERCQTMQGHEGLNNDFDPDFRRNELV